MSISNRIKLSWIILGIFQLSLNSCRKFVEIDPPKTELITSVVFLNDASAKAAVDGIYSRMFSSFGFASGASNSFSLFAGLYSDELINYAASQDIAQFFENAIIPANNANLAHMWGEPFQYIYSSNAILEGISSSTTLSNDVNYELTGQAKFIRAFFYFYLVNLYGDVPLYLTTDYRINSKALRTAQSQIYQQVIDDLKEAKALLKDDYSFSNGERIRPTRWAASAMLARTYLFKGDWTNAEVESSAIINSSLFSLVPDLNLVFLKNSPEAIWQLMPNQPGYNTNEGKYFILTSVPNISSITTTLISSFENTDQRLLNWIDSFSDGVNTYYFPYKYKIKSGGSLDEYSMILRLAEQYLIRAEARVHQNNIIGAQEDLNMIRSRAGLNATAANDENGMLTAILDERQHELFAEWGHRWLDMKRTETADSILAPLKTFWQPSDILFPIPSQEIQNNSHITQNAGY